MTAAELAWICRTPRLRMRSFQSSDHARIVAMHCEPRLRTLLVDDFDLDRPDRVWELLAGLRQIQTQRPGLGIWHTERWHAPDPSTLAEAQAAVSAGEIAADALQWLQAGQWDFCGWFNLMPMPEQPKRVEIGCRLLPSAWGTGLVLDGGEALLAHAFGGLGLDEVWGVCHPQHRSVHAVLATLGFEPQGIAPYCSTTAAYFRLGASAWAEVRHRPRRERQRAAYRPAVAV